MIKNKNTKKSYSISCPSNFRDKINVLCRKKKVNAGDIARSVILCFDNGIIEDFDDIGEPDLNDREFFFAKADKKKEKPIKIKPKIQLRLPDGYTNVFVRKALCLALAINKNGGKSLKNDVCVKEDADRLKMIVYALMFEPLKKNITKKEEAFYVFGIPPFANPSASEIKQRYKMLALIHHPDSELGSNERMGQINEAYKFLKNLS